MSTTWNLPMAGSSSISAGRTTINDGMESLRTNFSGTADPSSTVAFMWHVRSDQANLYMRNSGNSAFLAMGKTDTTNLGHVRRDGSDSTMTGNLLVNGADSLLIDLGRAGDTVNARIDLDDDNDTSIRASAEDTITFEIGGSDLVSWTATVFDTAHEIRAGADVGGAASHVSFTNTVSTDVTGTTITLGGDNILSSGAQVGWVKLWNGTTAWVLPAWALA